MTTQQAVMTTQEVADRFNQLAKMKGSPQAMNMDEIAVYEVRNGKIVKEQFFF